MTTAHCPLPTKNLFQVGVGSGGMVVLDLLARDPSVSRVSLVEPDDYRPHNVERHLFPRSGVGRLKADLAAEWLKDRRPELEVEVLAVDLTDPAHQGAIEAAVARCDIGVCAVDNEPAKYHFDRLFRAANKPWTLGEVLSGGIGGWVHRFAPGEACYGCVASHLQREAPGDPEAPAPDYSNPGGAVRETTVPATRTSIHAIAALHAVATLDLLAGRDSGFTSALFPLRTVDGVFDRAFSPYRFRIPRSASCLICSAGPPASGEDLDAALDQALARLGHD